MKDFIRIHWQTKLQLSSVFGRLVAALPAFQWRQGDSDMQGAYISGTNPGGAQIKLWFAEQPVDVTVSFRAANISESEASALVDQLVVELLPSMGEIVRVGGLD